MISARELSQGHGKITKNVFRLRFRPLGINDTVYQKKQKRAPFEAPFYISHAESFPLIVLGKLCKRDYLDKLKIKHSLMLLATVKVGHEAFARFATYGLVES